MKLTKREKILIIVLHLYFRIRILFIVRQSIYKKDKNTGNDEKNYEALLEKRR